MKSRKKQRGQAMAEYFLVAGMLLAALVVQLAPSNQSAPAMVLSAMKTEYAGFLYAVGLPPQP